MNEINRTLYIPLYGKALVSRKGLFLKDETAERLWEEVAFPLRSKAKSKWLAYFLGIRAAVFDGWLREQLQAHPDATVLHLGCGLDSRIHRVGNGDHRWYDVDFPAVIDERRRRFSETETYRMLGADLNESDWLSSLEGDTAIVVMEGVAMYLNPDAWRTLLTRLSERFEAVTLLVDVYRVRCENVQSAQSRERRRGTNGLRRVRTRGRREIALCLRTRHDPEAVCR